MQIRRITEPNPTLFTLTQTFRYLNCCCNVFLYSATSSLFRRQLKEIFQCSKSSIHHHKEGTILQATQATQARTPPSPRLHSANIDNRTGERKKLLVTAATSSTVKTKSVENVNLILPASSPTNGHTVSFKT